MNYDLVLQDFFSLKSLVFNNPLLYRSIFYRISFYNLFKNVCLYSVKSPVKNLKTTIEFRPNTLSEMKYGTVLSFAKSFVKIAHTEKEKKIRNP